MAHVTGYHRPSELADALTLLQRPGVATVVLAGGTVINTPQAPGEVEVVDLQALGLEMVDASDTAAVIGAMTTLDAVADDDRLPWLVRELARREMPSTLRSSATIGGTVAARDPESELLAVLLVHDAVISLIDARGARDVPLPQILLDPFSLDGCVITAVHLATDGVAAVDRTARTPSDAAIVAAVARRGTDGRTRVALTGVAPTPILVRSDTMLDPPADFRGSSDYRAGLASTLAARVRVAVA